MIWVKLTNVKANPNNPRVIRDEKFAKLKQSIIDFPEMLEKRPLVCFTDTDGKFVVLGGNMRLKALSDIGAKEIPIILADDWTAEQRAQFLIKDNVGFGEWDWEQLANEWDAQQLADWGLDLPPMEVQELEAEDDNYEMPDEVQTDIVLGDLFEIGEHRLLCGDSTDSDQVARLMNGEKADMVFTDPPYGMNFIKNSGVLNKKYKQYEGEENQNTYLDAFNLWVNMADMQIWWGGNFVAHNLPQSTYWISWNKQGDNMKAGGPSSDQSDCEIAWTNLNYKKIKQYQHVWAGWFRQGNKTEELNKKIHPSQKPVALFKYIFTDHPADKIADPFLGSGSTMVAAHQLKRKCYGMELDPKYCQVIIDRMLKLDPTLEVKRNGQTYNRNTTDG